MADLKFTIVKQTVTAKPRIEYVTEVSRDGPTGWRIVDVVVPIGKWIREQPGDQWAIHQDPAMSFIMDRFIVSDELYTMLVLRWL